MLVMVVFFIAFRWIHLSTPLISMFLLVLIFLLMRTLNFLPVWFALSLLRFCLSGPDRRNPHPASAGSRARAESAVGQLAVRRLLRGLPGEDRHPDDPPAPPRALRAGWRRPGARARRDGRDGTCLRQPPRLR